MIAARLLSPVPPLLIWNASASMPTGLYVLRPQGKVERGAIVVAWLPADMRGFAARRGYLPASVPAIKRVAAIAGDLVCARSGVVAVNGRHVAQARSRDGAGRPLPSWTGCRRLGQAVLLLGDDPGSFDGRYFGEIDADRVIGTARLLWES
ncbi:MAG: S26 family signal peptidase [Zymomonas sp.]|nr:MAG: S26 family signal peptidase [Zymomonas sp.]